MAEDPGTTAAGQGHKDTRNTGTAADVEADKGPALSSGQSGWRMWTAADVEADKQLLSTICP